MNGYRITGLLVLFFAFISCSEDEVNIDPHGKYRPAEMADWAVSTPAMQGLDPDLVLSFYAEADTLPNIYSLLIVKNNYLVAERYFNTKAIYTKNEVASVTKSCISALAGIALREHILSGLDQKMVSFFPEFDWNSEDPRKSEITIRQILQMRSGYPWEEFSGHLYALFSGSNWLPFILEFPLTSDPGTAFGYSNLTAHTMGVILSRASNTTLLDLANTYLFNPMNIDLTPWGRDASGYYYGSGGMRLRSRDMAKFGNLYLNNGVYNDTQIIPSDWINESLQVYSTDLYNNNLGSYFHNIRYGYLWWSAEAGSYSFDFAWGHGGQMIILIHQLDMVIVATADPLVHESGESAWLKTRLIIDLVGKYIASMDGDTVNFPPWLD